MKVVSLLAVFFSFLISFSVFAAGHQHHAKHNMVLFGEQEIFASHIVYKQPHNYQVILKLSLSPEHRALYLAERARFPKDRFIYLLSEMDIKDIESAAFISGVVTRTGEDGVKREIIPRLELARDEFETVFFDELPLSLE